MIKFSLFLTLWATIKEKPASYCSRRLLDGGHSTLQPRVKDWMKRLVTMVLPEYIPHLDSIFTAEASTDRNRFSLTSDLTYYFLFSIYILFPVQPFKWRNSMR